MDTCEAGLHSEIKRKDAPARYADMGFILPLFPGDVRDSDGRQLGGPEAPAHPSHSTLPYSVAAFQPDDVSSVVESACAAAR